MHALDLMLENKSLYCQSILLKYHCQSIMLKYHADIDFDKRLMCFASLDLDTRKSKNKDKVKVL